MPHARFALLLFLVILAAGATVWLGMIVATTGAAPTGTGAILPALLVGGVALRLVLWRWGGDRG